jgi:hypothetical protein
MSWFQAFLFLFFRNYHSCNNQEYCKMVYPQYINSNLVLLIFTICVLIQAPTRYPATVDKFYASGTQLLFHIWPLSTSSVPGCSFETWPPFMRPAATVSWSLFTGHVLALCNYYFRSGHCLQFMCHYLFAIWNIATISMFWSAQPIF